MDTAGRYGKTGEASTSANDAANEGQPLLRLIKILFRIIDNEEKTVLTNSQLMDILQKEFQIDVTTKTELEVDIYMNILKKFLKSWPRWDVFDKMIKDSKTDPGKNVDAILATECQNLKTYLKRIFTLSEGQMAPILEKLEQTKIKEMKELKDKIDKEKVCGEVIMEISCSRSQLNKLFFRAPCYDGTIFNITENTGPTKINLSTFSLAEILNWPQISVTISLPWIEAVRTNSSHIARILRNMKLKDPDPSKKSELSKEIYWRTYHGQKHPIEKSILLSLFSKIIDWNRLTCMSTDFSSSKLKQIQIIDLLTQFNLDFDRAPPSMNLYAEYQFFLSRSPYVRYLSTDPPPDKTQNAIDYDLHLEERISPAVTLQVTKIKKLEFSDIKSSDLQALLDTKIDWLKVECMLCDVKFDGFLVMYHLLEHFQEHHSFEADWTCVRCEKVFTMKLLACNRWQHDCDD